MDALRNRDAVPDAAKLHFSGHLLSHDRNAEGLRAILEEYFGVHAEIESFRGQWITIGADDRCRLGDRPESNSLGRNAVLGARVWECQHRFRVRMGPMSLADYARLLPDQESFRRLRAWVKNYVGDEFFWDVRLALKAAEVPDVQLGRCGQLGWTTWLRSGPMPADAADAIFTPETYRWERKN
jgi:type VI secretion system protein ImpH